LQSGPVMKTKTSVRAGAYEAYVAIKGNKQGQ
jgi:hypothetical protein